LGTGVGGEADAADAGDEVAAGDEAAADAASLGSVALAEAPPR
jgi:hypothetical protein